MEDKLTELSKVRKEENDNFKKKMTEWENKYKMMHDNLSSEIKLLTGKLNSMEEFRLQRDDLMAKFDTQEQEIKEQAKKHKAILYEMERKVILDKERMRKDVENKLLELSTEFTKTSDLRVAASTQRLVRENIALNNDMDRMMVTLDQLQRSNDEMKKKHKEISGQYDVSLAEKKRLIKTAEQQLEIIKTLTTEYENQKDLSEYLKDIRRAHEAARKMTRDHRDELQECKDKIKILENEIKQMNSNREQLKCETKSYREEIERVTKIIKQVRSTVKMAICGQKDQTDLVLQESQRRNLLTDLLNILNDLEKKGKRNSLENTCSVTDFYAQGDLGIIPKDEIEEIIENIPKLKIDSISVTEEQEELDEEGQFVEIEDENSIHETISNDENLEEEEKGEEEEKVLNLVRKTSMSIDLRKSMEEEQEIDDEESLDNLEQQQEEEIEETEGSIDAVAE